MDIPKAITTALFLSFGCLILYSYKSIATEQINGQFDYWFGIQRSVQYVMYVFQILAAIGFITYTLNYLFQPPHSQGLLKHRYVVPILYFVILSFSWVWAIKVKEFRNLPSLKTKVWVSTSLILVAIAGMLLFAGEMEDVDHAKWYSILGLLLFTVVTVLCDAVGWNARFILIN